jgi:hypothetical protein
MKYWATLAAVALTTDNCDTPSLNSTTGADNSGQQTPNDTINVIGEPHKMPMHSSTNGYSMSINPLIA